MSVLGTDLALEAAQAQLKTIRLTSQPGLTVRRRVRDGYALTAMDLTGPQQAEKLKRPMGKYITMELTPYLQRQQDFFARGARCIARELAALLPEGDAPVLVVGLGNRSPNGGRRGATGPAPYPGHPAHAAGHAGGILGLFLCGSSDHRGLGGDGIGKL